MPTKKPDSPFELCPFTIVIDSNEGMPFQFKDLRENGKPLVVPTVEKALWSMSRRPYTVRGKTYLKGLADYTIDGMDEQVQIERKELGDLFGSLGSGRDEFEARMMRLSECEYAAVVVEGDWTRILAGCEGSKMLPKSVVGTIVSWSQRYQRVHWFLLPTRAFAQQMTYKILYQFWKERQK